LVRQSAFIHIAVRLQLKVKLNGFVAAILHGDGVTVKTLKRPVTRVAGRASSRKMFLGLKEQCQKLPSSLKPFVVEDGCGEPSNPCMHGKMVVK